MEIIFVFFFRNALPIKLKNVSLLLLLLFLHIIQILYHYDSLIE